MIKPRLSTILAFSGFAMLVLAPCLAQAQSDRFIVLQSTTSTENSGLLKHILPKFRTETGIDVRVVAVGTGQAIKNAKRGDGDVLLVHAKEREQRFVADGFGVERHDVMYNDFVIVGPASNPAGIDDKKNVIAALRKIAATKSTFASRGDDSGTHIAERRLWKSASIDIEKEPGSWYHSTGSGMGATLNTGIGLDAYILTDRATWVAFRNKSRHGILVEADPPLFNQYGVILINPEKHPHVKAAAGQKFVDWLIGPKGQTAIKSFKIDGRQLFFPNAPTS